METIKSPDRKLNTIIGIQACDPNVQYRPSLFFVRVDCEDGILIHNTLTGELLRFSGEEEMEANRGLLIQRYYYVPVQFDEASTILQLRKLYKLMKTVPEITSYTILPTTCCNARCFYCYEKGTHHYPMTEQTAEDCVHYILKKCGSKKIRLHWFGGEPLLGTTRIDQICRRLTQENVPFESVMISNGYLFDDELVRKASELWRLRRVQITLDGTEHVYNRIKAYPGVDGSPFLRVMGNIDRLIAAGISVRIRMNMDSHNAEDLERLIDELETRYQGEKRISVYVAKLFDDESEEDAAAKAVWHRRLNSKLKAAGLGGSTNRLSHLKVSHCMADNPSSVTIAPDGTLGKCEHCFAEKTVGSIYRDDRDLEMMAYWQQTIHGKICESCPLQPGCLRLRGCFSQKLCDEADKERAIAELKETMLNYYLGKAAPEDQYDC